MSCAPRLLITRPEPEATRSAEFFARAGYEVTCLALADRPLENAASSHILHCLQSEIQCIALTSKRALDVMNELSQARHIPLFVVGGGSAEKARAMGFSCVSQARGNAASLIETLTQRCSPENGRILYLRGDTLSVDLAAALRGSKFTVTEILTYRTQYRTELPEELCALIRQGSIQVITAYSKQTLIQLERLLSQHALTEETHRIALACLSAPIARVATIDLWQKVVHAVSADDHAMLEAFKALYGAPPRITTEA